MDKEIIAGFQEETRQLVGELEAVLEGLDNAPKDSFPAELLREFAQKVDRIMGTANTLAQFGGTEPGLKAVGVLAGLCKLTGYQAAELKVPLLIPLFSGFWADTLEFISEVVATMGDESAGAEVRETTYRVLQGRMEWLKEKVQAAAGKKDGPAMVQDQIDALFKSLKM